MCQELDSEPVDYPIAGPFPSLPIASSIYKDVKTYRANVYFQGRGLQEALKEA